MFKREMKVNLKSYIIWISILIGIFLMVFLIQLYSENTSVGYCVKYIEDTYKELGYVMHDYIIERKVL